MIYLIRDNKVQREFDDIISWGPNFVEYKQQGYRTKMYCQEDEYFTDVKPEEAIYEQD